MKTLYVGNLPSSVTEDDLRAMFGRFGPVEYVLLVNDHDQPEVYFAFVDLDEAVAEAALRELQGTSLDGHVLQIQDAGSARPSQRGVSLPDSKPYQSPGFPSG